MGKMEIQLFDREHEPSTAQLEAACDLFQRTIPVFDEQSKLDNAETVSLRRTPDDYRKLLETKTLLLVCGIRESIAGLLEWNPRDKEEVMLAYITWMLVDEDARGQGLSTKLHTHFEQHCIPDVIRNANGRTVFQALAVHLKNPALEIYRKWGYTEEGAPQWNDGRRLFMIKEPAQSTIVDEPSTDTNS